MYKSSDGVLTALRENTTTLKSCQNMVSYYRKHKNIDQVLMFIIAIEKYKMFYKRE